jgi:phosphatidate cytidylyltransferase
MLRQRVITAVVLLALLIPALLSQADWPFGLFTLALIAAAGWEWSRLNAGDALAAPVGWLFGGLLAACCALLWPAVASGGGLPFVFWVACAVGWLVTLAWSLGAGVDGWPRVPLAMRLTLGAAGLGSAWLAMVQARTLGLSMLLSIFVVVWVADVAAYFGGKTWGRHRLAPRVSPGKTWEGALTGALAVAGVGGLWMAAATVWPAFSGSLFDSLFDRLGGLGAVLALALLVAASVLGDLFESLVKRSAGVKDSSGLLPGHGGVLDRIDALLPTFPLALALVS